MNHFPFALRNALILPFTPETDRRRHVNVSGAAMGYPGARVIVQDVSVQASFPSGGGTLLNQMPQNDLSNNRGGGVLHMLMRIGWKGKGYLTEELLPYGLFLNKAKPLTATWNFVRPYRMDPGEALTATMWALATRLASNANCGAESGSIEFGKCVGLMFHGVRIKDGNPVMLYDASQELVCTTTADPNLREIALARKTLACPADSSILLYSVSATNMDLQNYDYTEVTEGIAGTMAQIYSPSGRPWMSSIMANHFPYGVVPWAGITEQEAATYPHWIDPYDSLIDLGEERGWLKEAHEQITVELELGPEAASQLGGAGTPDTWPVLVTVRGSLEVPNA
jgi:hypothetical protein